MPTRNINLTDHLDRFVEDQVEADKYKNASEVVRAGLRLLEQQSQTEESKLAILKRLAAEASTRSSRGGGFRLPATSTLPTPSGGSAAGPRGWGRIVPWNDERPNIVYLRSPSGI